MAGGITGDEVLKLIEHFDKQLIASEEHIKEHCTDVSKQLIADVQTAGCLEIKNHLADHKESKKRLFGLITIIPATITAMPTFIKWIQKHL